MKTQVWRAHCPKCESARIWHVETVNVYREVLGVTDDGVHVIDNTNWPPDIDDDGINQRFMCRDCLHEWFQDGRDNCGISITVDYCDDLDQIEEV